MNTVARINGVTKYFSKRACFRRINASVRMKFWLGGGGGYIWVNAFYYCLRSIYH